MCPLIYSLLISIKIVRHRKWFKSWFINYLIKIFPNAAKPNGHHKIKSRILSILKYFSILKIRHYIDLFWTHSVVGCESDSCLMCVLSACRLLDSLRDVQDGVRTDRLLWFSFIVYCCMFYYYLLLSFITPQTAAWTHTNHKIQSTTYIINCIKHITRKNCT